MPKPKQGLIVSCRDITRGTAWGVAYTTGNCISLSGNVPGQPEHSYSLPISALSEFSCKDQATLNVTTV